MLRMKAAAGDPIYHQMQTEQRWDVIPGAEDWATLSRVTAGLDGSTPPPRTPPWSPSSMAG